MPEPHDTRPVLTKEGCFYSKEWKTHMFGAVQTAHFTRQKGFFKISDMTVEKMQI